MSDQNVFTEQTPQATALDSLVGEGKKYASVEDLAKSVGYSQKHIEQLEAETATYRSTLQDNIELQRQRIEQNRPSAQTEQRTDEVDLETRIRDTIAQTERDNKLAKNVNDVSEKLVSLYGSPQKANEVVKQKADELGVSIQFLMDSAAQSPKAFYAQIGLNDSTRPAPALHGNVNPQALSNLNPSGNAQPGTYAYYESLRKSNPKLYNSPKTQLQMHKDAMERGEAFFGS